MAVPIIFPDGSIRDVPGQLVAAHSTEQGKMTAFRQVPVNCDPLWHYRQIKGQWRAVPRHGDNIAVLTPNPREWWQSIVQMHDRPSEPETDVA